MNMNWRKKQNPIQKRGFCGDILNLITSVAEENCAGSGTGSGTGSGLIGGANNGAGLIGGPNTDLTITIDTDTGTGKLINFIQKPDSKTNFIHIMEIVNNDDYQGRFGIFTPVPSVNTIDYSLTIYDNNRHLIIHADKISIDNTPQVGYQITPTTTKNNGNTFNVYQTETCTINISDKKSSS